MKTLIIYATKNGATKIIAERISHVINDSTLCDVKNSAGLSISDYDCIILGSPLTAGKINKEITSFINNHSDELLSKRTGLFLSGLQETGHEECFKQNFSQELLDNSIDRAFLGGVFNPEKCNFLERKIIKVIAKFDSYTSTIDDDKIATFGQKFL